MKGQLRLSGGRKIQSPKGVLTRPTTARVREAVMNIIGARIKGCHWLDLCSGSGVMGCEALQRGAKRILAVEQNKNTAKICEANLLSIAADQSQQAYIEVNCNEVTSFLKKGYQQSPKKNGQTNSFDLVYLDPPYGSEIYSSVFKLLLERNWLQKGSLVICEHSASIALDKPSHWLEQGRRMYGSSALLLISPP